MTNSPTTERVSARCVAGGISAKAPPTPSPPMQQDALANSAGRMLLAVVFDGLGADLRNLCDVLGVLAFGDELEDFALANRQRFERAFLVSDFTYRKFLVELRGNLLT